MDQNNKTKARDSTTPIIHQSATHSQWHKANPNTCQTPASCFLSFLQQCRKRKGHQCTIQHQSPPSCQSRATTQMCYHKASWLSRQSRYLQQSVTSIHHRLMDNLPERFGYEVEKEVGLEEVTCRGGWVLWYMVVIYSAVELELTLDR